MNFHHFNLLSKENKIKALYFKAIQIDVRRQKKYKVLLYQLDGFYIEVFYHTERSEFDLIEAFEEVDRLKDYLDKINIDGLLNISL